jgi:hypothetical protein
MILKNTIGTIQDFLPRFAYVSTRQSTVKSALIQECHLPQTHIWQAYVSHQLLFHLFGTLTANAVKKPSSDSTKTLIGD